MENNYSRTKLLQTALEHSDKTMEDLEERLNMSYLDIYHNLDSVDPKSFKVINAVADALGIPAAYFWAGMYYDENGKLVPNHPEGTEDWEVPDK
ncbi:hypothetical protein AHMF7605_10285 [Adhaeribacter arboris]|uniref:HTH cro/C1-type domain-containing protein n=1 Tax=Adhaeribacter arboris TaxID=2072846 RepID=A0A2T2YEE1_9BACT|nr:hypothetical protein [Adhaeribacter arboris]PSR53876.1 hypothetical protein AHMF7605_10285 [Adhaeribacter arboris]